MKSLTLIALIINSLLAGLTGVLFVKIKPYKGGRDFRPSMRLTKKEWELIKQKAQDLKMSVSDWMVYKAKNQRKTK